jgi:hypothetical protein
MTLGRAACWILFLACIPLVIDAFKLCVAQWQGLYGVYPIVETPAIEWLAQAFREIRSTARLSTVAFYHLPWRLDYVVAGLFLTAIAGCGLLRRGARL